MGIIDVLKRWLNKNDNLEIMVYGDVILVPDRDYYKDNKNAIKEIDNYKEKYMSVLLSDKVVTTNDLPYSDRKQEMIMNVDIILNLCFNKDGNFNLDKDNDDYDKTVLIIKLLLYLDEIQRMRDETIFRLIALKEIKNTNEVSKININTLDYEINLLTNNLYIFMNQIMAIKNESLAYINLISIDNKKLLESEFRSRKERIIYLAKEYINVDSLSKMDTKEEIKIAIIERELEIYVYKHKDEVLRLKEELKKIVISKDIKIRKEMLDKVNMIEKTYKLFYQYGRNIINDDDLRDLYQVKFNVVMTNDKLYFDENFYFAGYMGRLISGMKPDIRIKTYMEMVSKKIEKILMGNNINLDKYFGRDKRKAINLIVKILKDNGSHYDYEKILYLPQLLNLIMALDDIYTLDDYFDNYYVNRRSYEFGLGYYEPTLSFNDKVPISTVYWINELYIDTYDEVDILEINQRDGYLYKLYSLYRENIDKEAGEYYYLPEGLRKIDTETPHDMSLKRILDEKIIDKIIVFPNSLKSVNGHLFTIHSHVKDIKLNDGLEKIGHDVLANTGIKTLIIPNSLKEISSFAINFYRISCLMFNNYKESEILKNPEQLGNLLNAFMEVNSVGNNLFSITKIRLYLNLPDDIILIDRDGSEIYLDLSEINYVIPLMEKIIVDADTDFRKLDMIKKQIRNDLDMRGILMNKLYDKIYNKTGYEFRKDKNNGKVRKRKLQK